MRVDDVSELYSAVHGFFDRRQNSESIINMARLGNMN